jgi:mRNA-degrading endonuclease RelE of RelBE toxin-antitoxin system
MSYSVIFHEEARRKIFALDHSVRKLILKKIARMKTEPAGKHLRHGLPYFIAEVGQYRIAYEVDEAEKKKIIQFVGDHKEYAEWYRSV